jgi:hypothetical protein
MLEREAQAVDAGMSPFQKTWLSAAYRYRDCGDFNEKAAAARQRLLSGGKAFSRG